jgi:hypothetical protein
MREMNEVGTHGRNRTPLVVRGSLPRTFLVLGMFMEVSLIVCGSYLLAEAILQPLDAGPVSVIGGGLILALATVLLFYLAWPAHKNAMVHRKEPADQPAAKFLTAYGTVVQARLDAKWVLEKEDELPGPM